MDDAFTAAPETRFLITHGNYLLLSEPPWNDAKALLDLAVFIDVPREIVRNRLMTPQAEEGESTCRITISL
jgi:pantothenate kinase